MTTIAFWIENMKKIPKKNLLEFIFLFTILFLGAIYLWYTLPKLNDILRIVLVTISIVLIIILSIFLKSYLNQKTSK